VTTCAASDGAPALVPLVTVVVKPEVPSPGVGFPQQRLQQWGGGAGLRSGGGGGKVVEEARAVLFIVGRVLVGS
jgi:hypothetical protein